MRSIVFLAVIAACGCAARPAAESSAPAAAAAPQASPAKDGAPAPLDPIELQKQGYRIVNEDGKTLYCRSELMTGSRVLTRTSCLTAEELAQLRDSTRDTIRDMGRQQPPPQGK